MTCDANKIAAPWSQFCFACGGAGSIVLIDLSLCMSKQYNISNCSFKNVAWQDMETYPLQSLWHCRFLVFFKNLFLGHWQCSIRILSCAIIYTKDSNYKTSHSRIKMLRHPWRQQVSLSLHGDWSNPHQTKTGYNMPS